MGKTSVLVTGALGQIGAVLVQSLRERYGADQVIATDIRHPKHPDGRFAILDVMNGEELDAMIRQHKITQIYHLAAILSAKGEQNPAWAWEVNMRGLFNILEAAKNHQLRLFFPSSIAVFGNYSQDHDTPQHSPLHPTTVYGISKAASENWCQYYFAKYGVDVRSVRYPGVIGYQSLPGGGTTDYAVEIYHYAVKEEPYICFLSENSRLPMLYMPDTMKATMAIMDAPNDQIRIRTSYNLAGMDFTPLEITQSIQAHYPTFSVAYQPDFRQAIADSWPASIDDHQAQEDWGWQPDYDLAAMTADMLKHLGIQHKKPSVV